MSGMSSLVNEYHIVMKLLEFSLIINDMVELIIFILKVDSPSVYWMYLRKPTGDSFGIWTADPQQYLLTESKNTACPYFFSPSGQF